MPTIINGNSNATNYSGNSYVYSNVTSGVTSSVGYTREPEPALSDDLPDMLIEGIDDYGHKVRMVLSPESNISQNECMKILMLVIATNTAPGHFNPYGFVRKNNLERHFKYS